MSLFSRIAARLGSRDGAVEDGLSVWMDPVEWSQVQAVVETLAPSRVLEWGSGGSTLAFLELFPSIQQLVSIEHHAAWFARVRQALQDERLHYRLFEPTVPEPDPPGNRRERGAVISAWMLRCEQEPEILHDYVAYPGTLGVRFDLVLVDGRARVHCMAAGWELLRPGGVLLLHDAQRPEYRETLERLGRPVFLEPWKQGQICLLRKPEAAPA